VSWYDCQEFIKKLNALTGKIFRLPSEAEWEYAARGGNKSKGYQYSGSNDIDDVAWYNVYDNKDPDYSTHAVKSKKPNELGIYDMSGNVREWCSNWYGSYIPKLKDSSLRSYRVLRGGSFNRGAGRCEVSFCDGAHPRSSRDCYGFRLVLGH
jgi:formylglycine-generating enzyme required for sulfatase activity